jgi:UvrD-like helicase C-terminal domain
VFINKVRELADLESRSLYEALKTHINEKELHRASAVCFVNMIEVLREKSGSLRISDLLQLVLEESLLLNSLRLDGDEDRLENIEELMLSIKNYEASNINEESINLIQYLQDIALYTNIDYKKDTNYVKLMTIHQSKGMEFKVVFVVGMSEGIFPNHRSIRERKLRALEEERRLAYVAITRAEKELFLTESEGFSYETGVKYPSRFIFEIKEGLLDVEGDLSQETIKGSKDFVKEFDSQLLGVEITFNLFDIVKHPVFDNGIIRAINTDKNPGYEIYFSGIDKIKPIRFGHPDLELVEKNEILSKSVKLSEQIMKNNQYLTFEFILFLCFLVDRKKNITLLDSHQSTSIEMFFKAMLFDVKPALNMDQIHEFSNFRFEAYKDFEERTESKESFLKISAKYINALLTISIENEEYFSGELANIHESIKSKLIENRYTESLYSVLSQGMIGLY